MPVYVSWILVFVLKNHHVRGDVPSKDPDFDKNVSELIVSKGYPVEEHSVTTPDGYILGVQRIPYGRDGRHGGRDSVRPAVLVMHGLLNSAADWVINFQNQSFGFILADAGYDVWLGNVRGNTYARQHATLDVKSNKYWDFSFDQMIEFDLPTTIDMVLGTTHQPMLYYAGYSQGALIMFGLLSAKPEYNTKWNQAASARLVASHNERDDAKTDASVDLLRVLVSLNSKILAAWGGRGSRFAAPHRRPDGGIIRLVSTFRAGWRKLPPVIKGTAVSIHQFLGTKRVIGSESSPNVDSALAWNTCSEHVIKQWQTGAGADL
ncbi:hypothetical protein HPB47_028154 [Ixodes persulcatus]|uniref:Uncharacterized protein n=1 Tax=Ixodes persulcatus TaxID=34615 RepID=A0AC60PUA5_IXOPE|nr:hypothetical protein HPB47_028154 [Ixodes persulcatus]